MPLSWNEIRKRAIEFSQKFADAIQENKETHTFYDVFFNLFGISCRRVSSFEERVKKSNLASGRIDLFWPGQLLVEQKSTGRNLIKAREQAFDYFPGLSEKELPRYVMISDFQSFELIDLDTGFEHKFSLADFHKNIEHFGFIAGYKKRVFKDQDKVNIEASEMMGRLHDQLKATGYAGPQLELFLVRLLFCLFADDTGIFDKDQFTFYIEERTNVDGSDLGPVLEHLFQVLNAPEAQRANTLDEDLASFPYVNGALFTDPLNITSFDSTMRECLLEACYFDWSDISPAIFGSLFQSVMDKDKRRAVGAHYTTEQNIMKVIEPLFLDELRAEFEKIKSNKSKLREFHKKLANLRFLDPACGCGNFLIIAYRELRLLEIEVLKILDNFNQKDHLEFPFDIRQLSKINVDHFYGIELEEFPARIAEVALWLVDHQMNMKLSEAFGVYYVRIPLTTSPHIVHGNALEIDWSDVIAPHELNYILGNPPFVGSKYQSDAQRGQMRVIFDGVKGAGVLDFVTAWYLLAARFIQGTQIKCAFVSTNSISQGEQVGILWRELFDHFGINILFAHRTFAWGSEARGRANVHVVIIGFAAFNTAPKRLFDYEDIKGGPIELKVQGINPYLVEGGDFFITNRPSPINIEFQSKFGNMPNDDGNLLLDSDERNQIILLNPEAKPYIYPLISAKEFINNKSKYCLWLESISPDKLKSLPEVLKRVENVRSYRLNSKRPQTRNLAGSPMSFGEIRQDISKPFILIPRHTSEKRHYLTLGFFNSPAIVHDSCLSIDNATPFHFGVLSSTMHMAWVKYVAGRLKSDFRYSNTLVYNNFPWPEGLSEVQKQRIETAAQKVLDVREDFPDCSLADLYDPLTMPPALLKAHQALDKAVDRAYRPQPFPSERHRIEFLFQLYEKLTAPLEAKAKKK